MMKNCALLLLLSAASSAQATYTLNISVGALYTDHNFTDPLTQVSGMGGAIGVLVADVANGANGTFPQGAELFGKSLSQYSNWGSSFYVINLTAAFSTNVTDDPRTPAARFTGVLPPVDPLLVPGMSTSGGHPVALYWFPTIVDTNPSTSNTGISPSFATIPYLASYGFYTNTVAQNNGVVTGNNPFVTPPNAFSGHRIHALNADALTDAQEALSSPTPSLTAFVADRVVPEPTTYAAVAGIAALALGILKRRNFPKP